MYDVNGSGEREREREPDVMHVENGVRTVPGCMGALIASECAYRGKCW